MSGLETLLAEVLGAHEVAQSEGDWTYCLGCEFQGWVEAHRTHVASAQAAGIHSWRCEHTDRYGPCNCLAETASDIAAALAELAGDQ